MKQTILPIESIHERDVDLILLEELSTDNSFYECFIRELHLPVLTTVNGVWRSISAFGLGNKAFPPRVLAKISPGVPKSFCSFRWFFNTGSPSSSKGSSWAKGICHKIATPPIIVQILTSVEALNNSTTKLKFE